MIALLAAMAIAQEPAGDEPLEVTVVGEVAIRDARARVIRAAEAAGWDANDRRGVVVLRPPSSWMGRARLTYDGQLVFGRPVLAFADIEAQPVFDPEDNPNLAGPAGVTTGLPAGDLGQNGGPPAPTAGARFWFLPSRGRLEGAQNRLMAAIDEDLTDYNRVVRATREAATLPAPLPPPPPR